MFEHLGERLSGFCIAESHQIIFSSYGDDPSTIRTEPGGLDDPLVVDSLKDPSAARYIPHSQEPGYAPGHHFASVGIELSEQQLVLVTQAAGDWLARESIPDARPL
jgi:hypothetical protein